MSLLLMCVASLVALQQGLIHVEARSFDYYYFVQQWPGSFCDTTRGCCYASGKPPADFSIHGLWPQFRSGRWPQFCDQSNEFDFSKVQDMEEELVKRWGSLSCNNNGHKFWEHEWEKHGTCTPMDERSYFEKALALRQKVDILSALKSAGIVPDGSFYSVEDIEEAIKKGVGYEPKLNCNKSADGDNQLLEVYLCVSKKDASTLIECPKDMRKSCPSKVMFPTFDDTRSVFFGGEEKDVVYDKEL